MDAVVRRHEALRMVFREDDGVPVQIVQPPQGGVLKWVPTEEALLSIASLPFHLAGGPLFRAVIAHLSAEEHILLLAAHPLVFDDWSKGILYREIAMYYEAFSRDADPPLAELPIQYADFARRQRQAVAPEDLQAGLSYWRAQVSASRRPLRMPPRPPPAAGSAIAAREQAHLPADLVLNLQRLASSENATLLMVLLAGFQVLLARYSGQSQITVGLSVSNRTQPELELLIGRLANTLVIGADLSGKPGFREFLAATRDACLAAHAYRHVPCHTVVPVFQALFALIDGRGRDLHLYGMRTEPVPLPADTAAADLTLICEQHPDGLNVELLYNAAFFEPRLVRRLLRHFAVLLRAAVASPDEVVCRLPLLGTRERAAILKLSRAPSKPVPALCLHDLFRAQARRTPDRQAIVCEDNSLSFAEVDARSDQLARQVRRLGAGPEVPVAVLLDRNPDLLVALLGVLKSGAACVPLDYALPPARLDAIAADCRPQILVTDSSRTGRLAVRSEVLLDRDRAGIVGEDADTLLPTGNPEDTAFLLYTSGTSGTPKAVLVPHRALVHHAVGIQRECAITPDDRVLQFASIGFDAALEEIFPPWLAGAAVVMRPTKSGSIGELFGICRRESVTILDLPTAYWHEMALELSRHAMDFPPSVRLVIIGGEKAVADRYLQFRGAVGPDVAVMNTYGITETAVSSTFCVLPADPGSVKGDLPIGRPLANTRVYVLDEERQPVPVGVPGEIYIAGGGVAKGYLHNPELTAERFLENTVEPQSGGWMYRSGDIGYLGADANVFCLGRADRQLKIRGFRIEPAEVETALRGCDGVRDAVAMAFGSEADRALVAYVVASGSDITEQDLRRHLAPRLPPYMIPAAFVFLPALPLNSNGKLERSALPPPVLGPAPDRFVSVPRTATEEIISNIWAEVLGLERLGVEDNFFELGGHSLRALQVNSRIDRAFGIELPFRVIFEMPTIASLAAAVDRMRRAGETRPATELARVSRARALPLSVSQEGLLFLHRMNPESTAFHIASGWRLRGALDIDAMRRAIDVLTERQEVLRTRFFLTADGPVQQIGTEGPEVWMEDLRGSEDPMAAARRLIARNNSRAFRLDGDALFRFLIVRLDEREALLAVIAHHSVFDAWSASVLLRDLLALYAEVTGGRSGDLQPLDLQFIDFVDWQKRWLQSPAARTQLEFWKARLSPLPPVLNLPTDYTRHAVGVERGNREVAHFPRRIMRSVDSLCQRSGATPFMGLLAAWAALIHRYTGQTDIAIATPSANRRHAEWEGVIGFFVNTLVIRCDASGDPGFGELVGRLRDTCLDAFANQDSPFERLVSELNPSRDRSGKPLIQVMIVYDNAPQRSIQLSGLDIEDVEFENRTAKYDLTLYLRDSDEGIDAALEYRSDLFRAASIREMLLHLEILLEAGAADPATPLSRLPILSGGERRMILTEWNRTDADYPRDLCVHHGIELSARRVPESVALTGEGHQVKYADLNGSANRLAHYLLGLGLDPGARVALYLERGIAAVTAILAVMKAGGVFVALDPSHPPMRTRFILEDCGAEVILTNSRLRSRLPQTTARIVCLETDAEQIAASPDDNPAAAIHPHSPCYQVYTSGSTGEPKGVIGSHGGAVNRICWFTSAYPFGPGEVQAHKTTLSFIDSLWEFLAPLWAGARIHIIDDDTVKDPRLLVGALRRHGASRIVLVPSHLRLLLDTMPGLAAELPALTHWISSGEAIPVDLCRRFFERMPGRLLLNLYGCSEASGDSACCELSGSQFQGIAPIGRPIWNTQLYVLDGHLQPVPIGVTGELYIGGEGVGYGYHNRPELTRERFIPDPFSSRAGATLYRTGDLARYLPDGNIVYMGRVDFQVKVRGQRIELGEIEAALARYPGIRQVVVDARNDEHGQERLVAYLVLEEGNSLQTAAMRAFLSSKLPSAMVPSVFVVLESMPHTPNGKVSRRDLPDPGRLRSAAAGSSVAPRNETEERVAAIWAAVLGIGEVGATDNFFDIGGDSINAVRMLTAAGAEFGADLSLSRFLQAPTVEHVADMLRFASAPGSDHLVWPVRSEGANPPLFCVHPNATDDGRFDALADHLGPDQPLYGIRIPAHEQFSEASPMRELASRCLEEIGRVQPRGPYFLLGYCLGGRLAFEIAVQLSQWGESVALLSLLDAYGPAYVRPAVVPMIRAHIRKLQELGPSERGAFVRRKVKHVARRVWDFAAERWTDLSSRKVQRGHGRQESLGLFHGRAVLFKSQVAYRDYEDPDPTLGWVPVLANGLDVVEIPGDHEALLNDLFVGHIAEQLSSFLAEARGERNGTGSSAKHFSRMCA